jgi:hypothetical protein
LDASEVVTGIAKYNPSILKMTHIEAFDAVVNELGAQNVKVLLENVFPRTFSYSNFSFTSDFGHQNVSFVSQFGPNITKRRYTRGY